MTYGVLLIEDSRRKTSMVSLGRCTPLASWRAGIDKHWNWFAAIFMDNEDGICSGEEPVESVQILVKGRGVVPERWQACRVSSMRFKKR